MVLDMDTILIKSLWWIIPGAIWYITGLILQYKDIL